MRSFAACLASAAALLLMAVMLSEGQSQDPTVKPPQIAKGVVYHDANGNQKRDADEKPLPGVRVSNGSQIVTTNEQGSTLWLWMTTRFLFVIKPRGWRTPLSEEKLPRFYYIHKPHGSPDEKFKYKGLHRQARCPNRSTSALPAGRPDQFKALLFGDPQPRDQKESTGSLTMLSKGSLARPMPRSESRWAISLSTTWRRLNRSIAHRADRNSCTTCWGTTTSTTMPARDGTPMKPTSGSMGRRTTPSTMGRSTFWCWMTWSGC